MDDIETGWARHAARLALAGLMLVLLFPMVARAAVPAPVPIDSANNLESVACPSAKTPAASAQVTVSGPALTASKALAKRVRTGKLKTLPALVTATNTRRVTTRIPLKLRAR